LFLVIGRLLFDTHEELNKWKTMFKDVIAQSLGDDSVRMLIRQYDYHVL